MMNAKGLTLIETLVATCVFSVAAVAITALNTNAFSTSDWNKDRAHALALVQSEFETFRGLTYAELRDQGPLRVDDCAGTPCGIARTIKLDDPGPGMAEVTIGVTWTGRRGARYSYAATTIITAVQR